MRERYIEQTLCKKVKERGGKCIKQTAETGIPDRLVLMPGGKAFFVELKAPDKVPRKIQEVYMKRLRNLGFDCYVVDNTKMIPELLDKYSN